MTASRWPSAIAIGGARIWALPKRKSGRAANEACSIRSRKRRCEFLCHCRGAASRSSAFDRHTRIRYACPRWRGPRQYTWPIVTARCCSASTDGPLDARITLVATSRYGRCGGISIATLRCRAVATDAMTLS